MKLATIQFEGCTYAGAVRGKEFIPFEFISEDLPSTMLELIEEYDVFQPLLEKGLADAKSLCEMEQAVYLPPLPNPVSFRDFMGFAEHYETSIASVGGSVPPEYYELPVFYFSNTRSLYANGSVVPAQPSSAARDFEFEIGFVIGKEGRDITGREEAMSHIFGYTVLNDWSARDLQMQEMGVNLGPAKGKDYATSLGPVLVTRDELEEKLCVDDPERFDLKTRLTLNGRMLRENNIKTILHTFASMIIRASKDVTLYPGELFGSGTIGGGCLLEYSREELPFLQSGDRIEMEVEGIGTLVSIVG